MALSLAARFIWLATIACCDSIRIASVPPAVAPCGPPGPSLMFYPSFMSARLVLLDVILRWQRGEALYHLQQHRLLTVLQG